MPPVFGFILISLSRKKPPSSYFSPEKSNLPFSLLSHVSYDLRMWDYVPKLVCVSGNLSEFSGNLMDQSITVSDKSKVFIASHMTFRCFKSGCWSESKQWCAFPTSFIYQYQKNISCCCYETVAKLTRYPRLSREPVNAALRFRLLSRLINLKKTLKPDYSFFSSPPPCSSGFLNMNILWNLGSHN